jgi:hypothetical protein
LGSWHCGQTEKLGGVIFLWVRRLSRRALDNLCFGFGMILLDSLLDFPSRRSAGSAGMVPEFAEHSEWIQLDVPIAPALTLIQILSADRTEPSTLLVAERLNRRRQNDVLTKHLGELETIAVKRVNVLGQFGLPCLLKIVGCPWSPSGRLSVKAFDRRCLLIGCRHRNFRPILELLQTPNTLPRKSPEDTSLYADALLDDRNLQRDFQRSPDAGLIGGEGKLVGRDVAGHSQAFVRDVGEMKTGQRHHTPPFDGTTLDRQSIYVLNRAQRSSENASIAMVLARLMAPVNSRWCRKQFPEIRRGTIRPRSVKKFRKRPMSLKSMAVLS